MHQRVVDATKKHLLYRPMVPDGRDIRFSSKIAIGHFPPTKQRTYEATHLTCFVGGMFALGGRLLQSAEDIDVAAKLADGCVWAYESMASGIMPEGSTLVPCPSMDSCEWNKTAWYLAIDPHGPSRTEAIARWEERNELRELRLQEAASAVVNTLLSENPVENAPAPNPEPYTAAASPNPDLNLLPEVPETPEALTLEPQTSFPVKDRAPDRVEHYPRPEPGTEEAPRLAKSQGSDSDATATSLKPAGRTSKRDQFAGGVGARAAAALDSSPSQPLEQRIRPRLQDDDAYYDKERPMSHEEMVENILADQHLPPGFAGVQSKYYILR